MPSAIGIGTRKTFACLLIAVKNTVLPQRVPNPYFWCMILPQSFYTRKDVVKIARELLGKVIVTNFDGIITSGMIVETEAYAGEFDKASHAYGNRRTARTETMFKEGGVAYVYLCYGIHHL